MLNLQTIVATSQQMVALHYRSGADDDKPDVICQGQLDENGIQIWRMFEMDDVQSICTLPENFGADFLVMNGDGQLLWLGQSEEFGQITGAGYRDKTARKLGRMSKLQVCQGSVFALGHGGQAYRCDSLAAEWTFMTEGLSTLVAAEDAITLSAMTIEPHSQTLYVGGRVVGGIVPDAEEAIDAANEAGDAEALVELLLGNVKRDRGGLWQHRGKWEEVSLPVDNPIVDLFSLPGAMVILCTDAEILCGKHGGRLERRTDERPNGQLQSFCGLDDRVLLSFSDTLYSFDGDVFAPFSDAAFSDQFHHLLSTPLGLLAASPKQVRLLREGTWSVLPVGRGAFESRS